MMEVARVISDTNRRPSQLLAFSTADVSDTSPTDWLENTPPRGIHGL